MAFMKPQVLLGVWIQFETSEGTQCVPKICFDRNDHDNIEEDSIEEITGYGARLSAPGYLDCTEWTVFETETEAWQNLLDNYEEAFEWIWEPGHGYHMYCYNSLVASLIKNHYQSINGNTIEQDGSFIYTIDESEEPTEDVPYVEEGLR